MSRGIYRSDYGNLAWSLLGLAALAIFAVCLRAFGGFVADDAYIVGRYALNAADGLGLVYNAGERVSALTSPFHAMVLTAISLVSEDPVAVYRWGAPIILLCGAVLAIRFARLDLRGAAVFAVIGLAPPNVALWSLGGLETPLLHVFLGIFTALLVRIWRQDAASGRDFAWLGMCAALAFLTRFDSVLVTAPPLAALGVAYWRRPALWAAAGASIAGASAWLLFSYLYYGGIFPTSAYLKLASDNSYPALYSLVLTLNVPLVAGFGFVLPFLRLPVAASALRRGMRIGGLVAGVLLLSYAVNVSSEHMMFGYRFFMPYLPVIGLLAAAQAERVPVAVLSVALAVSGIVGVRMATQGTNIVPLAGLPDGTSLRYEWAETTPSAYARTISAIAASTAEVRTHWDRLGRDDTPRIFLWSGGAGYWLRDFYVYETLVSYRRDCPNFVPSALLSAHYVQDLPVGFTTGHAAFLARRPDIGETPVVLSETSRRLLGDSRISYTFGPAPADYRLPATMGGACGPSPASPALDQGRSRS